MTQVQRISIPLPHSLRGMFQEEENEPAIQEFLRRARSHGIFMELGCPQRPPMMSQEDWIVRYSYVDENRVTGHLSNVDIDFDNHVVIGDVRAYGPYREVFQHALKETPTYSFRPRALVLRRKLVRLIGWDLQPSPALDGWLHDKLTAEGSGTQGRDYFQQWTRGTHEGSSEKDPTPVR